VALRPPLGDQRGDVVLEMSMHRGALCVAGLERCRRLDPPPEAVRVASAHAEHPCERVDRKVPTERRDEVSGRSLLDQSIEEGVDELLNPDFLAPDVAR